MAKGKRRAFTKEFKAPATVVLRMPVLKHLHDWSFDECEREVRGSLVYRAFCRIDGERVPDAKTLIRLARLLDEPGSRTCWPAWWHVWCAPDPQACCRAMGRHSAARMYPAFPWSSVSSAP